MLAQDAGFQGIVINWGITGNKRALLTNFDFGTLYPGSTVPIYEGRMVIGLRRSLRFVESVGYQIGRHVSDSRRGASGAGGEVGSFALDFEVYSRAQFVI